MNGPTVIGVSFGATFFSDYDCDNIGSQAILGDSTVTTGSFETVSGTLTAPAGTLSVQFFVNDQCTVFPVGRCSTVIFDDLSLEVPTTAVTFRSLAATVGRQGVLVRWRTASELDSLGFNVYREVNHRRVRLNRRLIATRGASTTYSFLDRRAPRGKAIRYWVQEVAGDGSRTWHGPTRTIRRA